MAAVTAFMMKIEVESDDNEGNHKYRGYNTGRGNRVSKTLFQRGDLAYSKTSRILGITVISHHTSTRLKISIS